MVVVGELRLLVNGVGADPDAGCADVSEFLCQVPEVACLPGATRLCPRRGRRTARRGPSVRKSLSLRLVPVWSGSSNSSTRSPRFIAALRYARSGAAPEGGKIPTCRRPPTSTVTTTREQFRALAAEHRFVPVTRKVLADSETPLVGVPEAGRQPARHVPARIRRERPVLVAVVVHRRRRPVGADRPRRRSGVDRRDAAGRSARW